MSSIKVAIRIKPSNSPVNTWGIDESESTITLLKKSSSNENVSYKYNHVFGPTSTTKQIFDEIGDDIIKGVMNGINGTIFAYGSTGSGKTYTIMGDTQNPGIVPLSIDSIFNYIEEHSERKFTVSLSYFEIYNETVKDLLKPNSVHVGRIQYCKQEFSSSEDLINAIIVAESNRATGSTLMNEHSSRSHAIVRIDIKSSQKDSEAGVQLQSTLNMVDLAGSECQKDTGAIGKRQIEASNINKSLLALSTLIDALQNGKAFTFRDSKLTYYLRDSIGGNSLTTIICAINVENSQISTTKSTLKFASGAMKIKNQPKVNEIKIKKDKIKELLDENRQLKEKLYQYESGQLKPNLDSDSSFNSPKNSYESEMKKSNSDCSSDETQEKSENQSDDSDDIDFPLLLPKKIITRKTNEKLLSMLTEKEEEQSLEQSPILPKKIRGKSLNIQTPQYYDKDDEETDRQAESLSRSILENSIHIDLPLKKKPNTELVESLKKENEELKLQNNKLIEEKDELELQNEKLIEEKEDIEAQFEALDNDFVNERNSHNEKIKELEEKIKMNEVMSINNNNYQDEILKLQDDITKSTNENNELKSKVILKEAEIKGLLITQKLIKEKLSKKDSVIIQLGERNSIKQEELTKFQQELDEKTQQYNEIYEKFNELEQKYQKLVETNKNIQNKIENDLTKQNDKKNLMNENEENKVITDKKETLEQKKISEDSPKDIKTSKINKNIDNPNDNISLLRKKLFGEKAMESSNNATNFKKLQSSMIQRLKEKQNILAGMQTNPQIQQISQHSPEPKQTKQEQEKKVESINRLEISEIQEIDIIDIEFIHKYEEENNKEDLIQNREPIKTEINNSNEEISEHINNINEEEKDEILDQNDKNRKAEEEEEKTETEKYIEEEEEENKEEMIRIEDIDYQRKLYKQKHRDNYFIQVLMVFNVVAQFLLCLSQLNNC